MQRADTATARDDEHAKHYQAERASDIAEHGVEGVSEKIADPDKACLPDSPAARKFSAKNRFASESR